MAVEPVPDGYRTVTPYLIVDDAARALDFYARALGAKERMRFADPGGKIGHAELELGDSVVMLADEQFYGDRSGTLVDPFGHVWILATHVEDVSPEELQRRAGATMKQGG